MITPLRLVTVVAAAIAALGGAAAASHTVVSANVPTPTATSFVESQPGSHAPAWGSDSRDDFSCSFTADPGYLHGDGDSSQVIQENGHAYMGCDGGPTISLDDINGDTVTFSLHGDRVRVRQGTTERLGPYRVHVDDVRGRRVELELSDAG